MSELNPNSFEMQSKHPTSSELEKSVFETLTHAHYSEHSLMGLPPEQQLINLKMNEERMAKTIAFLTRVLVEEGTLGREALSKFLANLKR